MTTTNDNNTPASPNLTQIANAMHALRCIALKVHNQAGTLDGPDGLIGTSYKEMEDLLIKLGREAYTVWKETEPAFDAIKHEWTSWRSKNSKGVQQ